MLHTLMLTTALLAAPTAQKGRWMTHKVERGDTVAKVAKRWGVSEAQVRTWNPWVGPGEGRLKPGRVIQLRAKKRPVKVMNAVYFVRDGDAHNTGKGLEPGTRIVLPRPLGTQGWNPYEGREGASAPSVELELGGLSAGSPNNGTLVNGVALPQTELFDVWKPEWAYGSTHAVGVVVEAIATFRQRTGWDGTLTIGSMSKFGGGHFPPHKSHQSGRDVDIRLPRLDGSGAHPNHAQTDWHAAWALISAFIDTGEVQVIFLSRRLHGMLRAAAKDMGATPRELARIGTIISHSKGHNAHLHIRMKCGVDETDCQGVK
ncbi:MAG: penicillin-insensitive murein endopeptidase [bacterium]|nr:penicillin-insensitive murein endopeptidase [bacterium]